MNKNFMVDFTAAVLEVDNKYPISSNIIVGELYDDTRYIDYYAPDYVVLAKVDKDCAYVCVEKDEKVVKELYVEGSDPEAKEKVKMFYETEALMYIFVRGGKNG